MRTAAKLSDQIGEAAGSLAKQWALRGADAIHLASALAIGTGKVVLAAWDRRLATGGMAAGLRVVPSTEPLAGA